MMRSYALRVFKTPEGTRAGTSGCVAFQGGRLRFHGGFRSRAKDPAVWYADFKQTVPWSDVDACALENRLP